MSNNSLRAYSVLEHSERTGDIYFARHAIVARKAGANEFGDGELANVECRRAPWADKFAPGPVPWAVRIAHGWRIECSCCGQRIEEDAYDDNDEPIEFDIVEEGPHVFCDPSCQERYRLDKADANHVRAAVIDGLIDIVMRQMPGALISEVNHAYVYVPTGGARPWPVREACVEFMFPGGQYRASIGFKKVGEKPTVSCARGDLIAFYRWRDAGYPPAMMDAPV